MSYNYFKTVEDVKKKFNIYVSSSRALFADTLLVEISALLDCRVLCNYG